MELTTAQVAAEYTSLRALYRSAMDGNADAITEVLNNSAHRRLYPLPYSSTRERAASALWTVRDIVQLEGMREGVVAMRAAWESGDMVTFLATVTSWRRIDGTAWDVNQSTATAIWSLAITLRYEDRSARVLAEARALVPSYLDSLERDAEYFAERRGLLCRVEHKALHEKRFST